MRPILALGFLLLGIGSAVPEPKHPNTLVAATDEPSGAEASLPEPISIDRLIGSIELKSDVDVPSLEVIEASHEQQDSAAEPPPSGEAATAATAIDRDVESLDGLCNTLFDSAQHNDLPVPFFANLIWQESRLRHDAVSPVGAQGIAQFMPRVAAAVGLADPFDPRQALPASARLLRELRDRFRNLGSLRPPTMPAPTAWPNGCCTAAGCRAKRRPMSCVSPAARSRLGGKVRSMMRRCDSCGRCHAASFRRSPASSRRRRSKFQNQRRSSKRKSRMRQRLSRRLQRVGASSGARTCGSLFNRRPHAG